MSGTAAARGGRGWPGSPSRLRRATSRGDRSSSLLGAWLLVAEGALGARLPPAPGLHRRGSTSRRGTSRRSARSRVACIGAGGVRCTPSGGGRWWLAIGRRDRDGRHGWSSDRGLTSWTEVYVGVALRRRGEVSSCCSGDARRASPRRWRRLSARIPFRLKLASSGLRSSPHRAVPARCPTSTWRGCATTPRSSRGSRLHDLAGARRRSSWRSSWRLLGALGRLSSNPVAYGLSGFYTSFFRGTPLIVQLFLIYLALPQIGAGPRQALARQRPHAHAVPGGRHRARPQLRRVHDGDLPSRDPVGRPRPGGGRRRARHVVRASGCAASCCPRPTRVIIPPTGNEFIAMMKDTALVGVLGGVTLQSRRSSFERAQHRGQPGPPEAGVAPRSRPALYWALTAIFTFFQAPAGAAAVEGLRARRGPQPP